MAQRVYRANIFVNLPLHFFATNTLNRPIVAPIHDRHMSATFSRIGPWRGIPAVSVIRRFLTQSAENQGQPPSPSITKQKGAGSTRTLLFSCYFSSVGCMVPTHRPTYPQNGACKAHTLLTSHKGHRLRYILAFFLISYLFILVWRPEIRPS